MKKIILSSVVVLAFVYYSYTVHSAPASQTSLNSGGSLDAIVNPSPAATASPTVQATVAAGSGPTPTTDPTIVRGTAPAPASVPTRVPTPIPTAVPTQAATGQYKNGTYTGPSADAIFGNVQVQITVSGGKLAAINFLDYPQDRGHSAQLSQEALPILRSEAIAAQSASVDAVSGASQTSRAFVESLSAALAMAK